MASKSVWELLIAPEAEGFSAKWTYIEMLRIVAARLTSLQGKWNSRIQCREAFV